MTDCHCKEQYAASINPELASLLGNREALLARISMGSDVALPTFRPRCIKECDEAASLMRLIAAARY